MEASSATRRLLAGVVVRDWAWWRLPWLLRCYVGSVPLVMLVVLGYLLSRTTWQAGDLVTFLVLLGCGVISVVATPRIAYLQAGLVRDFLTRRPTLDSSARALLARGLASRLAQNYGLHTLSRPDDEAFLEEGAEPVAQGRCTERQGAEGQAAEGEA